MATEEQELIKKYRGKSSTVPSPQDTGGEPAEITAAKTFRLSDAGYSLLPKPRSGMEEFTSPAPDLGPSGFDPTRRQVYEPERGDFLTLPRGGERTAPAASAVRTPAGTASANTAPAPTSALPSERYFRYLAGQGRYADNANDPRYANRGRDVRGAVFDGAYNAVPGNVVLPEKDTTGARAPYTITTDDLVDLYGKGARSTMSDEENQARIAARRAPSGTFIPGAFTEKAARFAGVNNLPDSADREDLSVSVNPNRSTSEYDLRQPARPESAMPSLDLGSPGALLMSAVPYAARIGQNRARAAEAMRKAQALQQQYGIDMGNYLKRLELQQMQPKITAETAKAQAEAAKAGVEAQATAGRTATGAGKLSLEDRKNIIDMYQNSPEAFSALYGDPSIAEPDAATKSQWLKKAIGMDVPAPAGEAAAATTQTPRLSGEQLQKLSGMAYELVRSGKKTRAEVDADLRNKGIDPAQVWGNS